MMSILVVYQYLVINAGAGKTSIYTHCKNIYKKLPIPRFRLIAPISFGW